MDPAALASIPPVAFWLLAAGSALEFVVRYRRPERTIAWYAVNGLAFLDPGNFVEGAERAHRRMLIGFAEFVASAGGLALVAAMAG